jgi:hypothetical protein
MSPKVLLILADAAQAVAGKLHILGGGWSIIVAGAPFAVAFKVEIPYSRGADQHEWRLSLVDADGQPVLVPMNPEPAEPEPLVVGASFCTGIPPGITPGTPLDYVYTWSFGPGLPLLPNGRYQWQFELDGQTHEDWSLGFTTGPTPLQQAA